MNRSADSSDTSSKTQREFEDLYVRPNEGLTLMCGSRIYEQRTRHHLFDNLVGVDLEPGPGVDVVADLEDIAGLGPFDHVECTSVLEHAKRPWKVAEAIEGVMRRDASIYVSVPFVWRIHAYPSDYWRFTLEGVRLLFPNIIWKALMYADLKLHEKPRVHGGYMEGHYHVARSEVVGFGYRA